MLVGLGADAGVDSGSGVVVGLSVAAAAAVEFRLIERLGAEEAIGCLCLNLFVGCRMTGNWDMQLELQRLRPS